MYCKYVYFYGLLSILVFYTYLDNVNAVYNSNNSSMLHKIFHMSHLHVNLHFFITAKITVLLKKIKESKYSYKPAPLWERPASCKGPDAVSECLACKVHTWHATFPPALSCTACCNIHRSVDAHCFHPQTEKTNKDIFSLFFNILSFHHADPSVSCLLLPSLDCISIITIVTCTLEDKCWTQTKCNEHSNIIFTIIL